ncbi:MAG TPA: hypothetical protein VM223_15640 [Planctomycetota bacterium]|nr:hypothetical protein [Planctomycetota bacterium]
MTQRLMGMVTALVIVLGLSAAVADDAMKGRNMMKEKEGAARQCPLEVIAAREGVKDIAMKSCPLCDMMGTSPSPAAWVLIKKDELNLTDKQIKKLNNRDEKFRKDIADYDADIVKSRAELNKVFVREKWDAGDLEDALQANAKANIKYISAWAEGKEDAFDELTDEQKGKLMNMACKRTAKAERAERPMAEQPKEEVD